VKGKKRAAASAKVPTDILVEAARMARARAYAPYSNYKVGAAIMTKSGRIFAGCNVENSTYGAAICAERNAIVQMVAAGEREPVACAVVTGGPHAGSPCGICRQVLAEFARDMPITLVSDGKKGNRRSTTLAKLIPDHFGPEVLDHGPHTAKKKGK
jgi:cytidine deaminase